MEHQWELEPIEKLLASIYCSSEENLVEKVARPVYLFYSVLVVCLQFFLSSIMT